MQALRHRFLIAGILCFSGICGVYAASPSSPYAGQETRDIKALSAEDVSSYLAGKGMGLAKTAELNGYPGPLHVLELAEQLKLSAEQKTKTRDLYNAMQAKAVEAGRALIDAEQKLDRLFASKTINPDLLDSSLKEIGALQAKVRGVHLEAHLQQAGILNAEQVARYNALRGYDRGSKAPSGPGSSPQHSHGHKH